MQIVKENLGIFDLRILIYDLFCIGTDKSEIKNAPMGHFLELNTKFGTHAHWFNIETFQNILGRIYAKI